MNDAAVDRLRYVGRIAARAEQAGDPANRRLHIGGGGEASYTITKPGTYSLQVSGTDTWRIWVEPERPTPRG